MAPLLAGHGGRPTAAGARRSDGQQNSGNRSQHPGGAPLGDISHGPETASQKRGDGSEREAACPLAARLRHRRPKGSPVLVFSGRVTFTAALRPLLRNAATARKGNPTHYAFARRPKSQAQPICELDRPWLKAPSRPLRQPRLRALQVNWATTSRVAPDDTPANERLIWVRPGDPVPTCLRRPGIRAQPTCAPPAPRKIPPENGNRNKLHFKCDFPKSTRALAWWRQRRLGRGPEARLALRVRQFACVRWLSPGTRRRGPGGS